MRVCILVHMSMYPVHHSPPIVELTTENCSAEYQPKQSASQVAAECSFSECRPRKEISKVNRKLLTKVRSLAFITFYVLTFR